MLLTQAKTRLLLGLATVSVVALVGAAAALATSQTNNISDPALEVSASMLSSSGSGDVALVGETVTTALSVKNNSATEQFVHIFMQSDWIRGRNLNRDFFKTLAPGETWSLTAKLQVYKDMPAGLYEIGVHTERLGGAASEAFAGINVGV